MLQLGTLKQHFIQYKFLYLGIFVLFFIGFFIGGFYANTVSYTDFETAKSSAELFISSAKSHSLDYRLILWEDLTPYLWMFLFGIVLLGFPGILYFLFQRGFSTGFFLSFLIKAFSMKGLFLAGFFLICELLFFLPALLLLTAGATRINLFLLRSTMHTYRLKQNLKSELFYYLFTFLLSISLVAIGGITKHFFLPPFCRYLFV